MTGTQLLWQDAPQWIAETLVVVDLIIRVIALGVVPRNRHPSSAWGWLLVIFFLPILGALVFLVLGRTGLPEERAKKQRHAAHLVTQSIGDTIESPLRGAPRWVTHTARLNEHNAAFPLVGGNQVEILTDYNGSLQTMAEQIRSARSSVHFQFYIAAADTTTEPVITALEDAHRRGVTVRVLIDHLGAVGFPGYRRLTRRLRKAGIPWQRMLPVRPWRGEYQRPDLRNHRKILVIDRAVAFTGSQNVIARSYNKRGNRRKNLQWQDLMLRIQGPVVAHLEAVFATDWASETDELILEANPASEPAPSSGGVVCQVLPSGPGLDVESNLQLFNHLFASAEHSITICSPYFVPEDSMYNALRTAVGRGVAVHLYVGETSNHALTHHAQRSYYEVLIKAGVRIFLYTAPYVLHSKFVLIDDEAAVVGSSNMDIRSFTLDLEINLMITDTDFVARMREVEHAYQQGSHELELEIWLARPWYQKYLDHAARLTSALQ